MKLQILLGLLVAALVGCSWTITDFKVQLDIEGQESTGIDARVFEQERDPLSAHPYPWIGFEDDSMRLLFSLSDLMWMGRIENTGDGSVTIYWDEATLLSDEQSDGVPLVAQHIGMSNGGSTVRGTRQPVALEPQTVLAGESGSITFAPVVSELFATGTLFGIGHKGKWVTLVVPIDAEGERTVYKLRFTMIDMRQRKTYA